MAAEANLEQYLVDEVKKRGGECIKLGHGRWPDRLVILPGKPTGFLELKAPGEVPTAAGLQMHRIQTLRALGQMATWANSKKLVDDFLFELEFCQ